MTLRRTVPPLFACLLATAVGCSDSDPPEDDSCRTSDECEEGLECVDQICVVTDVGGDVLEDATDTADTADAADTADVERDLGEVGADAADVSATDASDADATDGSGEGDVVEDVEEEVSYPPLEFTVEPEDNAQFIPLDTDVVVTFNQPMNTLRLIASNIQLFEHGTTIPIPRTIDYDPETFSLIVTPVEEESVPLRPATPHHFTMAQYIGSVSGENLGVPFRSTFSTDGYDGRNFQRQIAEAYAPVIYQEVVTPEVDTFTRIDFDGNTIGADKVDNARVANYGFVYYDAIESVTHWFLTYLIYYPGTVIRDDMVAEHDFVTVQVVVQKTDDDPLGEFRAFSTVYHDNLFTWTAANSWYADGTAPTNNGENIDGRLRDGELEDDRHVSIFIESGRHSACLLNESVLIPSCAPEDGDTAPFEEDATGLVYRVGEAAQREGDAADDALTYSLRSLVEEVWSIRHLSTGDAPLFGGEFTYDAPSIGGEDGALRPGQGTVFPSSINAEDEDGQFGNLPFVFDASDDENSEQGTYFVDPAWNAANMFTFPETFSRVYCFNPYLNIDERTTLEGCTDPAFMLTPP